MNDTIITICVWASTFIIICVATIYHYKKSLKIIKELQNKPTH